MKFLKAICTEMCGIDSALADLSDMDLLNTIQNLTEEVTLAWAQGIPVYKVGQTDIEFAKADLVASLTRELQTRLNEKELELDLFYRLVTSSTKRKVVTSILSQRHREETDRKEWALVSKASKEGKRKILFWFGPEKPSEQAVKKEEKRVQYFKHAEGNTLEPRKTLKKAIASPQPNTGWIVKIDVENNHDDIYYTGPFRSDQDAKKYVEEFHAGLDGTEIIPLNRGL